MEKKVILFLATSGGGLGHLTRSLAIATQLRILCPEFEFVFITSSNALEIIRKEGFLFYYIPDRNNTSRVISNAAWMHQMEAFLREIIWLHKPLAVIYDAAYPYQVVNRTLLERKVEKTVWIKRECYKPQIQALTHLEEQFGRIIIPKEFSFDAIDNTEKKKYVDPIMYLDLCTMYDRAWVREKYRVKRKNSFLYVQLGQGIINDIRETTAEVIEAVRKTKNSKILLGEYLIVRQEREQSKDIAVEREYPISRYFNGIDLAVTAAGYNTFHELLACRVPTLFVPNVMTKMDDQSKRAMLAESKGYGLCLGKNESVREGITRLFEHKDEIKKMLDSYHYSNGAVEAAKYILEYIQE